MTEKESEAFFLEAIKIGMLKYEELKDDSKYFNFELLNVKEAISRYCSNDFKISNQDNILILSGKDFNVVKIVVHNDNDEKLYTFSSSFSENYQASNRDEVIQYIKKILENVRFIWRLDLEK